MSQSTYVARHSGRHRAPVARPERTSSRPGVAAAALALTATGAALIPGLGGSATAIAAQEVEPPPTPAPAARTVSAEAAPAVMHIDAARTRLAQDALQAKARQDRAKELARVSRAKARERIVIQRHKALAAAQRWVMPVSQYRFSSDFGMRWGRLHAGDDFAAPIGTRIGSLSSGTVIFAGYQNGYGNKVEVRHWDGTVSYYGHMSRITVHIGEKVTPGAKVGEVGNTGHSTGPHLHLEIHPSGGGPVDPLPWLAARGLHI